MDHFRNAFKSYFTKGRGKFFVFLLMCLYLSYAAYSQANTLKEVFCGHRVLLDNENKLLPWYTPMEYAYDHFLDIRWNFIKSQVPNSPAPHPRSDYPQYYFYCAFIDKEGKLEPDSWMNDVGEKLPNWFESARLYYAYTGDFTVMQIIMDMADYYLEHGTSPPDFSWPDFPYTTTNAGDIEFRGFTNEGHLALHEIQVDHAAEMGLTYFRLYRFSENRKYLDAALHVADVLADKARDGNAEKSVWPYRVVMSSGEITAEYGANWTGAYQLFDNLIDAELGNVEIYKEVQRKVKIFLNEYPMKTGYWTDGHSDTHWNINTYKSNLSASNMTLTLFDFPELDPNWKNDIPALIKWTEDYFIFRTAPGEISDMYGANIVGEQDSFIYKMDYQTARYAAECARWYAVSGDKSYKEKAFRSLNWVTYCNDSAGKAFESPLSSWIHSWWSDCYGECPRMFYHAFAGIPEWAPPGENHILYSEGVLKNVKYTDVNIEYDATDPEGEEYLRLAFKPNTIRVNGKKIKPGKDHEKTAYSSRELGNGDFALTIYHRHAGRIIIQ